MHEYLEILATQNIISNVPRLFNKVSCSCDRTFQNSFWSVSCISLCNLHIKPSSISCKRCFIVIFKFLCYETIIRITIFCSISTSCKCDRGVCKVTTNACVRSSMNCAQACANYPYPHYIDPNLHIRSPAVTCNSELHNTAVWKVI